MEREKSGKRRRKSSRFVNNMWRRWELVEKEGTEPDSIKNELMSLRERGVWKEEVRIF